MMEARLVALFKTADEYELQGRFKGETLKGKTYLPLFSYYAHVCLYKSWFIYLFYFRFYYNNILLIAEKCRCV